jgi:beta-phosphoglucomutase-like phosphatase (HAD superfamily)
LESLLRDEISHELSLQEEIRLHARDLQGLKDIVYGVIDALVEVEAEGIGIGFATNSTMVAGLIAGIAGCSAMASVAYLPIKSESSIKRRILN